MKKNIPFEIHITTNDLTIGRQEDFVEFCLLNKAKPLMIELFKGDFISQPMFSKIVLSNNIENIFLVSSELSKSMIANNFYVKRLKIEVPAEDYHLLTDFQSNFDKYFEWHCKIKYTQKDELLELCEKHKVHLSLNSLKNEENIRFITLREFGTKLEFLQRISILTNDMQKGNWTILKQQSEYCIYDNNNFLDNGWLPQ